MRTSLLLALLVPSVALAGIDSSSHKKTSRTSDTGLYDASAAVDGKPETAWLVDPESPNEGSWIELDLPKGKVDKFDIIVGWDKDDETWEDHARLAKARIEVFSMAGGERKLVHEQTQAFEDVKTPQTVDLPDPEVGDEFEGGKLRITVQAVHAGKDYAHMALGDMLVHLVEFDALIKATSGTSSQADDDHDGMALTDDSKKTYWVAAADDEAPSFTVNAGRYSASSILITPGPSSYARPKTIEIQQGANTRTYTMKNSSSAQRFLLPPLFGYTGSNFGDITVKVVDTYPGSSSKQVAVTEVDFKATGLEAF